MLALLIFALATWRIANFLSFDPGPFDIFDKFRHFVGVRYTEHSIPYGTTELARGILCVWCSSVWIGTFWVILYLLLREVSLLIAAPFSLSAACILLEGVMDALGNHTGKK